MRLQFETFPQGQQTIIYVVDRFTCSACWHGLTRLAAIYPRLQAANTAVLVIGDEANLLHACRLARKWRLPFRFTAGSAAWLPAGCSARLALIDRSGAVRYQQLTRRPQTAVDAAALLTAVRRCPAAYRAVPPCGAVQSIPALT